MPPVPLSIGDSSDYRFGAQFGNERFAPQQDNAGLRRAGRQVHVDQNAHESAGQANFPSLGETGRERKSFADILFLKVWEVGQKIFNRAPRRNRLDDHPDGHAHSTNTRFAAHHCWIDCDPPKFLHAVMVTQARPTQYI